MKKINKELNLNKELSELKIKIVELEKKLNDWVIYYRNHLERLHEGERA